MAKKWRQRLLTSTRGRVISLLRFGPRTVNELATSLELTDNAIRTHLSALERDGLVEQAGTRRSERRPASLYQLSVEAESLFPKAYATVLAEVLASVREELGDYGLEVFLRSVGRRAGERASASSPELRDRVDAAAALLGDLGGLAQVEELDDAFLIRGFSCPLAAIVGANPEACALAEELVSGVVGADAHESCDRSGPPRCSFRIATH